MDFWQVLPVALALVLIIEGILPFISPARWRVMIATVAQMEDRVIRNFGLGSMMLGLLLLYLVRSGPRGPVASDSRQHLVVAGRHR